MADAVRRFKAEGGLQRLSGEPCEQQFVYSLTLASSIVSKVVVISKKREGSSEQCFLELAGSMVGVAQVDTAFAHGELMCGTKVICYLLERQRTLMNKRRLVKLVEQHDACFEVPVKLSILKPWSDTRQEKGRLRRRSQSLVVTILIQWRMWPIRWRRRALGRGTKITRWLLEYCLSSSKVRFPVSQPSAC